MSKCSKHKRHGRSQPYTSTGIKRIPCFRCGSPASFQWQVCADKRLFRPLCAKCDIGLNSLVLKWMNDPNAAQKLHTYRTQVLQPISTRVPASNSSAKGAIKS